MGIIVIFLQVVELAPIVLYCPYLLEGGGDGINVSVSLPKLNHIACVPLRSPKNVGKNGSHFFLLVFCPQTRQDSSSNMECGVMWGSYFGRAEMPTPFWFQTYESFAPSGSQ